MPVLYLGANDTDDLQTQVDTFLATDTTIQINSFAFLTSDQTNLRGLQLIVSIDYVTGGTDLGGDPFKIIFLNNKTAAGLNAAAQQWLTDNAPVFSRGVFPGYLAQSGLRDSFFGAIVYSDSADAGDDWLAGGGGGGGGGGTLLYVATNNFGTTGYGSLAALTTGQGNVGIGLNTLSLATSMGYTVAIGNLAAEELDDYAYHVAIGSSAMRKASGILGCPQIAVGPDALYNGRNSANSTSPNIAFGWQAMYGDGTIANNTGVGNTALGTRTLRYITSGTGNTVVGQTAGTAVTEGSFNAALGWQAGNSITTGDGNTMIGGSDAASTVTTGDYNTTLGYNARFTGAAITGSIAIGYNINLFSSYEFGLGYNNLKSINITGMDNLSTAQAYFNTQSTFNKGARAAVTALVDGANIAINLNDSNDFSLSIDGARTLDFPSPAPTPGQSGFITITNNVGGTGTLAYAAGYVFAGGTAPTLTAGASAVDQLVYRVIDAATVLISLAQADIS